MSDSTQSQVNGNSLLPGNVPGDVSSSFPPEVPIAQPSDFFPPIESSSNTKKFAGGKIIATFLSMLFLVGGVGAGIVLVQNPQLIKQKASDNITTPCDKNAVCAVNQISGSKSCINLETTVVQYCCPLNYKIVSGVCATDAETNIPQNSK